MRLSGVWGTVVEFHGLAFQSWGLRFIGSRDSCLGACATVLDGRSDLELQFAVTKGRDTQLKVSSGLKDMVLGLGFMLLGIHKRIDRCIGYTSVDKRCQDSRSDAGPTH